MRQEMSMMTQRLGRSRGSGPQALVEVVRGRFSVAVPTSGCVDAETGKQIAGAIRELLATDAGQRIELRLACADAVSFEGWGQILAASVKCQGHGVWVACEDMRPEVREVLKRMWNDLLGGIEGSFAAVSALTGPFEGEAVLRAAQGIVAEGGTR